MDTDAVERLKREWTGRKVEITGSSATLRRFAGRVGTIMTVNMNGRALVRFAGDVDIAWYDLDFTDLREVVPNHERTFVTRHLGKHAPHEPKHAPSEPAKPAGPSESASPAPERSGRPSTAEILKLARQQGAVKHP